MENLEKKLEHLKHKHETNDLKILDLKNQFRLIQIIINQIKNKPKQTNIIQNHEEEKK